MTTFLKDGGPRGVAVSAPSIDPVALLYRWASIMQDSANNDGKAERRELARSAEADFRKALRQAEADADEMEALRSRVAELEAANGEPVAWTVSDHSLLISHEEWKKHGLVDGIPLYTVPPAPTVGVDAISDDRLMDGVDAYFRERDAINDQRELKYSDFYKRCMRAALRAIFNKGE